MEQIKNTPPTWWPSTNYGQNLINTKQFLPFVDICPDSLGDAIRAFYTYHMGKHGCIRPYLLGGILNQQKFFKDLWNEEGMAQHSYRVYRDITLPNRYNGLEEPIANIILEYNGKGFILFHLGKVDSNLLQIDANTLKVKDVAPDIEDVAANVATRKILEINVPPEKPNTAKEVSDAYKELTTRFPPITHKLNIPPTEKPNIAEEEAFRELSTRLPPCKVTDLVLHPNWNCRFHHMVGGNLPVEIYRKNKKAAIIFRVPNKIRVWGDLEKIKKHGMRLSWNTKHVCDIDEDIFPSSMKKTKNYVQFIIEPTVWSDIIMNASLGGLIKLEQ